MTWRFAIIAREDRYVMSIFHPLSGDFLHVDLRSASIDMPTIAPIHDKDALLPIGDSCCRITAKWDIKEIGDTSVEGWELAIREMKQPEKHPAEKAHKEHDPDDILDRSVEENDTGDER